MEEKKMIKAKCEIRGCFNISSYFYTLSGHKIVVCKPCMSRLLQNNSDNKFKEFTMRKNCLLKS